MSEDTGRLVGGRYRLGEVLGRGGMGTVWRGEDEILGRSVAVKELRFPSSVEEDEKQRLITRTLREAKAIARIRSGSAVTVFDVVDEDDRPWIVMELVEGGSLADHIRKEGPLTPQRAAEVGLAVLDVLRAAHREGVLHRDVKPSNVLLEDVTNRVVLTDFGIAKVEGDPSVTSTGMLVGAPSYISPERARGKPPGPPADLWSLGALLYAAVEGHPPYDKGSAISTLTAVMTEPVPSPKQAGELSEVIFGLLVKDPDKRLDVDGARALLKPVASGSDSAASAPASARGDSTAVLPVKPDGDSGADADEQAAPATGPDSDSGADPASGSDDAKTKSEAGGAAPAAEPRSRRGRKQTAKSPAAPAASKKPAVAAGAALAAGAAGEKSPEKASATSPAESGAGDRTGSVTPGGGGSGASTTFSVLVGRFSRRSLAIAAALVAVLALLAVYLVNTAGNEGGNGGKSSATSGAGAGEGSKEKDAPAGKKDDEKDGDDEKPGASAEPSEPEDEGDGGKDEEGASLPDGYTQVTDDGFHFSMAMPEGFKRTGTAGRNSGAKYSGGGLPKLQVDYSADPLANAAAGWRKLEPVVRGSSNGYHLIGIKKVSWRGYPTVADWQFEREEDGRKVRVLNRGFKVDGSRGYAIMITCAADAWDDKECKTLRQTAFKTFKPLD